MHFPAICRPKFQKNFPLVSTMGPPHGTSGLSKQYTNWIFWGKMAVDKSAFCFECGPYWPFFAQAGPKNGKCLEVLPIFFRTTGLQIKLLMLICSMKFLSPEVALHLYKSTIHPYIEYCCHVWAGAPRCYLNC